MQKGQSSMEFFLLAGIAFLVTITFIVFGIDELKNFSHNRDYRLVKDLGLKLQKETMIAAGVEDGYLRTFTLPARLHATVEYGITTSNSSITVNSTRAEFIAAIPGVIGNFSKGQNRIEKIAGIVYVNQ